MKKCIANCAISTGCAVKQVGTTRIYAGQLLKPWTWLSFETVSVVEPIRVDHAAVVDIKEWDNPVKYYPNSGENNRTVTGLMRTYFPGIEYSAYERPPHMITLTLINAGDLNPLEVENSLRSKLPRPTGIRVQKQGDES